MKKIERDGRRLQETEDRLYDKYERLTINDGTITWSRRALKGHVKSFEIDIKDKEDPAKQLNLATQNVNNLLETQLEHIRCFKCIIRLKMSFAKSIGEGA